MWHTNGSSKHPFTGSRGVAHLLVTKMKVPRTDHNARPSRKAYKAKRAANRIAIQIGKES